MHAGLWYAQEGNSLFIARAAQYAEHRIMPWVVQARGQRAAAAEKVHLIAFFLMQKSKLKVRIQVRCGRKCAIYQDFHAIHSSIQ
jgi:hypothetical protein